MQRVHYGWYVCIAGTLLIFMTMGVTQNGFSVFLPYIMRINGFTDTQTSSLITIRCFSAFFSMLSIGRYYKRFSIRVGTFIAALFCVTAFAIYATADNYMTFCIGAAISGFSYGLGTMIPVAILMNRWFVKHRALAISICSSGSGCATIILPPVITTLIEEYSLKTAFTVECIGVFLIAVLVFLVLRNEPSEKGLTPVGQEGDIDAQSEDAAETSQLYENSDNSHKEHTFTIKMWMLLVITGLLLGGVGNSGFVHLTMLYTTEGFDAKTVAVIISVTGMLLTAGKILYGEVTDKIGGFKSSMIFCTLLIVGHVFCCLAFTQNLMICIVNVILLGVGYAIATIGPSVWAGDLATESEFPIVVRRLQILYSAGSLIFSNFPGILADAFDSYIPAYVIFTLFSIIIMAFILLSYRIAGKL